MDNHFRFYEDVGGWFWSFGPCDDLFHKGESGPFSSMVEAAADAEKTYKEKGWKC